MIATSDEQRAKVAEMSERMPVGSVLYTSWGWEQTNIDFYQVVARAGQRTVIIREIGRRYCKSCAPDAMQDEVLPVRDAFKGPSMRKRVGPYGVKITSYAHATPTDWGKRRHMTWYG